MNYLMELAAILQQDWTAAELSVIGGGIVGLVFGFAAERSNFCTRSAMATILDGRWRRDPNLVLHVLVAMLASLALLVLAQNAGLDSVEESAAHEDSLRIGGILFGTMVFGVGMALSRSCVARLLVLTARGNVRSLVSLVFLGLVAWASISGILAGPRSAAAQFLAVETEFNNSLAVSAAFAAALAGLVWFFWRRLPSGWSYSSFIGPVVIGALVPASFIVTGVFAADPFDPVPVEGLRYIEPTANTLAFIVYADALPVRFGLGLTLGTLAGAAVSVVSAGRFKIEGFDRAPHPLRYIAGASLMGFSGVIAGGCSTNWLVTNTAAGHIGVPLAVVGLLSGMAFARRFLNAD